MRAPLVAAVTALVLGLAAGLQRPVPPGGGPVFMAAALVAAVGVALVALHPRARPGGRRAGWGILGAFLLAGTLLGAWARAVHERSCLRWLPEAGAVEVRGVVAAVGRPGSGRLELQAESAAVAGPAIACTGRLPARWDGAGAELTGRAVVARGRWWSPPGGRGGGAGLRRPGVLLLDTVAVGGGEDGAAGSPRPGIRVRPLAAVRTRVSRRIGRVFPRRPELVRSLLLAERDGLDPGVRDRFARAGLSHLLAISGLHVGLVAGILLLVAGTLSRGGGGSGGGRAGVAAAAGTAAYVAFLGAPHSAVRAALQIVLVLAARWLQRPARTGALIATAALVILAAEPGAVARPGFQLSFAGVAGLLVLRPPFLDGLRPLAAVRVRGVRAGAWLADGLATSTAATLATFPVVAWHFGRVAPVGVLANLVAIPLLGAAVPALALALAAGTVWLPAGRFLAGGAEAILGLLDRTATLAAALPFATLPVRPAMGVLVAGGLTAGALAARRLGRVRPPVRAAAVGATLAATLALAPLDTAGDRVEVHVVDVGQGDAIALRSPAGRWLLVDAGLSAAGYDAGARRVVPYLRDRGAGRLFGLIITHPDADHMGGARAVAEALGPRWMGGPGVVAPKPGYLALLESAREAGRPWIAVRRGMELDMDGMTIAVLFPDGPGLAVEDANDASVVLRVEYGAFSALLTGDAPAQVEEALVARYGPALEAEVLKVGHHGSTTSTTPALLRATGATAALISVGRGNRYGHPHPAVLARLRSAGAAVYRTDRHGSIVVVGRADGRVRVRVERGSDER